MVGRKVNPIHWISGHIPRSQAQLESEVKGVLKIVFWVALLAPVILVPLYYLVMALVR